MVSPLHLVSSNNHIKIASLLISAGAKLDLKDADGKVIIICCRSREMDNISYYIGT